MAAQSRGFMVVAALCLAPLALLANTLFVDKSQPKPTLYCVSSSAPFTVTTLNESLPSAQCFRVQNGLFSEVTAEQPIADSEPITYLHGYVLPGIIESHGHLIQYGEMLESVLLYGARSIEEVRRRIKDFLKVHDGEGYGARGKWIRGIGWDQAYFGGVMPTAKDLGDDPALDGLYIMLDRVDVHCVWTSQRVLELLSDPLPDAPPGGVVVTDPGPGVFCDNAMDVIIYPLAPKPDKARTTRWFRAAMTELNKVGIIGVGDAGMRPEDVRILESMAENQELTIRINVMLECVERNTYCPEEIKGLKLLDSPNGLGNERLMIGGVKLFADGALGSWGAAMLEPYFDKPDTSGTMLINETNLNTVVKEWFDFGLQVNIHAIGDRANRAAVDAFESVLGPGCAGCNHERRLRIEHAQIIFVPMFFQNSSYTYAVNLYSHAGAAKLTDIIESIPKTSRESQEWAYYQAFRPPTHATSDMAYALSRLGSKRLSDSAYRMSSLFPTHVSSNNKCPGPVLGSDFPVEPPNPFHGMFAAVTRLNPETRTSPSGDAGWYPEESLTVKQALTGFTRNAAYGWFKEEKAGAIEVGKWADWIVVDQDIFKDETGRTLRDVVIRETWIGGQKVYPIDTGEFNGGWFMQQVAAIQKVIARVVERLMGYMAEEL